MLKPGGEEVRAARAAFVVEVEGVLERLGRIAKLEEELLEEFLR